MRDAPKELDQETLAIKRYTGFRFCFFLIFWLPIFYEYQLRLGISTAQILGIQSIYYVVVCFLEIPTGIIADRIGPRKTLGLGSQQ